MRISQVRVSNFRCLGDVVLSVGDVTALIGANGAGKSSLLSALDWFFHGGDLELQDTTGGRSEEPIVVQVTFTDLNDDDREALGKYGTGATAVFWRSWETEAGTKLTGRALAFKLFESIRSTGGAKDLRTAYNALRTDSPDLDLPKVQSKADALAAMDLWEGDHPDRLTEATVSATHLFGFVGTAILAGRFGFTLVPASADASDETTDARGTLLARLIERAAGSIEIDESTESLREDFEKGLSKLLGEGYEPILRSIEESLGSSLQQYVSSAGVRLSVSPPVVRLPDRQIVLRATDGDHETDVARQGHGLQRALLMAALQELAGLKSGANQSGLMIAIEEPELFQHPTQARHFASVLRSLADDPGQSLQVAYATHSPYFIDAGRFEDLRRLGKSAPDGGVPTTGCAEASFEAVRQRLDEVGLDEAHDIEKARITLRRDLGEAVFARAVLLVEGRSDSGLYQGVATASGGFDAAGVACISLQGKQRLPLAMAVLQSIGIPTFVIFDGDQGQAERMKANGTEQHDIDNAQQQAVKWNRIIVQMAGGSPTDWPNDVVGATYAVFRDCLETFLAEHWPEVLETVRTKMAEAGTERSKPEEFYEAAAQKAEYQPEHVIEVMARVMNLAKN